MERVLIKDLHEHVGKDVNLAGWVNIRRDHGKLIFIDLRDASDIVQMVAKPENKKMHMEASRIRPEWVIKVSGMVNKRPAKLMNKDQAMGDIEMELGSIEVLSEALTPPFDVTGDGSDVGEESRLEFRYIDLRRPRMQKNIRNRSNVVNFLRNQLLTQDFVEIETPILTKSTPEGARDFIVPSRLEHGKFYALPQSPQQYKQLLMIAGFEKYFQFARALRDEDTRGDRQAEHTQLDIEMSFIEQDDILNLLEDLYTKVVKEFYPNKKVSKSPWPRLDYDDVLKKYDTDHPDLRKNKKDPNELAFAWITDFPLFEEKKEGGHFAPSHHMFTLPKVKKPEDLDTDTHSQKSYQHDLVLNGYEIAGGSLRISDGIMQDKIYDLIGFSDKQKKYFSHMMRAFKYGVPPHGGIAGGVDRLLMLLEGEPNVREVIAFPKTGEGRDLMMGAPSEVDDGQLKELGIEIRKKK